MRGISGHFAEQSVGLRQLKEVTVLVRMHKTTPCFTVDGRSITDDSNGVLLHTLLGHGVGHVKVLFDAVFNALQNEFPAPGPPVVVPTLWVCCQHDSSRKCLRFQGTHYIVRRA